LSAAAAKGRPGATLGHGRPKLPLWFVPLTEYESEVWIGRRSGKSSFASVLAMAAGIADWQKRLRPDEPREGEGGP
jgi:hypothetical protein